MAEKKNTENTEVKEVKEKKERKTLKERGLMFVEKHPKLTSGVKTVGKVCLTGVKIVGEAAIVTVSALATLKAVNKLTGAVDVIDVDNYQELPFPEEDSVEEPVVEEDLTEE